MADALRSPTLPDGMSEAHAQRHFWHGHASPISILLIGALLLAALVGIFGGQPHPTRTIETSAAIIKMQFPERLRNGELFEMRAVVKAKTPIKDMRIGISSTYWRDLTINTMVPAPSDEKSGQGQYRFSYGAMKPGDVLTIKIDGQINPPMFAGTKGDLTLLDGEAVVAKVPLELTVFP